jgi:hypothetical protein
MDYQSYLRGQLKNAEKALEEAKTDAARAMALVTTLEREVIDFRDRLREHSGISGAPSAPNGTGTPTKTEVIKRVLRAHKLEGIGRRELIINVNSAGLTVDPKYVDAVLSRFREQNILRTDQGRYFIQE